MAGPTGAGAAGARKTAGRGRLAVVVRPEDALGFRLAGARVEEDVLAAAPERLLRRARERGLPVILPFAQPRRWSEEGRGRAYVAALIRRAVGYGVKLGGETAGRERGR